VITLRPYYRRKPQTLHDAESNGIPIYGQEQIRYCSLNRFSHHAIGARRRSAAWFPLRPRSYCAVLNQYNSVDLKLRMPTSGGCSTCLPSYGLTLGISSEPNRYVRVLHGERD
jgi:hypothetical protein